MPGMFQLPNQMTNLSAMYKLFQNRGRISLNVNYFVYKFKCYILLQFGAFGQNWSSLLELVAIVGPDFLLIRMQLCLLYTKCTVCNLLYSTFNSIFIFVWPLYLYDLLNQNKASLRVAWMFELVFLGFVGFRKYRWENGVRKNLGGSFKSNSRRDYFRRQWRGGERGEGQI